MHPKDVAERQEFAFLMASLTYCLVLASLSVRADQKDEIKSRALDSYDRTLAFVDRVRLTPRESRLLKPLQQKIEARLMLLHGMSEHR
jgi:hypothetical protein